MDPLPVRPSPPRAALGLLLPLFLGLVVPAAARAVPFADVGVGGAAVCGLTGDGTPVCIAGSGFGRDISRGSVVPPDDAPPLADIQGGLTFNCALTTDGDVDCWGRESYGALDVPAFDAPIERLAVGVTSTCALDGAGVPTCWGLNGNGQLSPPDPGAGFARIAVGTQHGCGIRLSGETVCWGRTDAARRTPPAGVTFTEIDVAADSCGLTDAGAIRCWGRPLAVPADGPYTALTLTNTDYEGEMVCGLDLAGRVDCAFTPSDAPYASESSIEQARASLPEGGGYTAIDAPAYGGYFGLDGCALGGDGDIDCWGVRNASPSDIRPPSPRLFRAAALSATSVELAWTPVAPELVYDVLRDGVAVAEGVAEARFVDDTVPAGASVGYRVVAIDPLGRRSAPSEPLVTVDTGAGTSDIGGPVAAVLKSVRVYSDTAVGLVWDAFPDGYDYANAPVRWDVFRDGALVADRRYSPNLFAYGLEPGVPVAFTIVGIDGIGRRSEPSEPVLVDTARRGGIVGDDDGVTRDDYPVPVIERVVVYSDTAVGVRWRSGGELPFGGRPRYDVLVDGERRVVGSVGPGAALSGLVPGRPVEITVVQGDGTTRGAPSAPAVVDTASRDGYEEGDGAGGGTGDGTPPAPVIEDVRVYSGSAVGVTWRPGVPNPPYARYDVLVDGSTVFERSTGPGYFIDGLSPGVPASVTIVAIDAAGARSAPSAPVVVDTANR